MFLISDLTESVTSGYGFIKNKFKPAFVKKFFESVGKQLGGLFEFSTLGKVTGSGFSALFSKGMHFESIQRNVLKCLMKEGARNTLGKTPVASMSASFIFDLYDDNIPGNLLIWSNAYKAGIIASAQLTATPILEYVCDIADHLATYQTGMPAAGFLTKFLLESGSRAFITSAANLYFDSNVATLFPDLDALPDKDRILNPFSIT
jgi:hypothetical protein